MATIKAEVEVDVDANCGSCGNDLDTETSPSGAFVMVEPCKQCMKGERDEGYAEGQEDAATELAE